MNYKERGNGSLSDNLKYINDTVSHLEINRFQGAGDIMYQVVAKALTLNFLYLIDRFIKDSQMPYNKIYKGINIECHFILSKPPEKILKIGKIIVAIIAQ